MLAEIPVKIQDFAIKMFFLNFFLKFLEFFNTSFYLWYNSLLPVKYRIKPIKCLEMRAKIKSYRYMKYLVILDTPEYGRLKAIF